ncbi:MAG: ubiquinone biosynthesis methyltransferase UbiE [Boseongicola sp.]|nr:MAG: ubiquinone biosynthesis methyltransferase UbiE [Boseongicola sp.]
MQTTSRDDRTAFIIKWAASIIQILGYAATGFGLTPWNIYFSLVGVVGWFIVGYMWKDRALMLIHLVAFGAMIAGMASA